MHLVAYQAFHPDNLYRLCSIHGHTIDDLQDVFQRIISAQQRTIGIILDIQNGLSLFPKEAAVVFARQASGAGIKYCFLAIVVQQEDLADVAARYNLYPELVDLYGDLEVKIFSDEAQASLWVTKRLKERQS